MKLSFTTRSWDYLDPEELFDFAERNDFGGVEFSKLFEHPELFERGGVFDRNTLSKTVRRIKEKRLSIPCVDTSLDLAAGERPGPSIEELIEFAGAFQSPYVSFCVVNEPDEETRQEILGLLPLAEKHGVTLLIETKGVFADTARLAAFLDGFADDRLAVLWDAHRTFRLSHETPDTTINHIGGYVRHVHLMDSRDDGQYCLLGEGTVPFSEIVNALSSIDYDGFISFGWKMDWDPELKDRDVIFPHFINYMRQFDNTRGKKKALYYNFDGSGQYLWKRDELLNMTFPAVLDRVVEEFPDQYAFKYTTLDYTRTYEEFRRDVDRFAAALIALGVRAGSKVAVWATNVPEWFISFWAAAKIGAVLVTVNTAYKIHEAEYLLRQSDTHTLVMIERTPDSDYRGIINELCPEIASAVPGKPLHAKRLPFLRNVITVGFRMSGCLTFDEAMAFGRKVPLEEVYRMAAHVRPGDVCNMQYTSGTTGFPKGVMLTHYNVINDGKCIGDRMELSTADRMMVQVPMFHCFGMVLSMTASMTHGATLCPLPYFSAKASLACINQEKITCFNGVPTMFIAMFNHPNYRKTDFSHIRTGIMAGSGCPPELMKRAADPNEMNMRGIVSVYGQTESSPGSTMSAWTDDMELRTGTVGYALPHIECKVIDPETGEEVPDGMNGEFCSRGYNTMKGYYKMPEATAETVDRAGWLHSGDIARKNPDGTFVITGRLKDMIIRGGENLYPREIEEFIYTHPMVKDVQVIAIPDEKYGEEAMACVVLKEPGSITEEELRSYMTERLARHKVPKYIVFRDGFPMNAAGKVLKYKLREEYTEMVKNGAL